MAAITQLYEPVRLPAGSQFYVRTNGLNGKTGTLGITDNNGTPLTNADFSAFVSIYRNSDGVELVTAQPMTTWVPATTTQPGFFQTIIDATVLVSGEGPWTREVRMYGPGGLVDTPFAEWRATIYEQSGAR